MKQEIIAYCEDEDGNEVFDLDADEANGDWMRAARLARAADAGDEDAAKELKRMEKTPLYPQGAE